MNESGRIEAPDKNNDRKPSSENPLLPINFEIKQGDYKLEISIRKSIYNLGDPAFIITINEFTAKDQAEVNLTKDFFLKVFFKALQSKNQVANANGKVKIFAYFQSSKIILSRDFNITAWPESSFCDCEHAQKFFSAFLRTMCIKILERTEVVV